MEPMSKSYPIIKPIVVMVVVNNENRTLCDPDCQFNGANGCGLFSEELNNGHRRPQCIKTFGHSRTTYKPTRTEGGKK